MKYILLPVLILMFLSCSDEEDSSTTTSNINGKWVEIETRMDTLSFEIVDNYKRMNLNRGKEIINGYLLPKYASGPYDYEIREETIILNWMLSSNVSFDDYYFSMLGNTLNIGNFFNSEIGDTLTFEKIE